MFGAGANTQAGLNPVNVNDLNTFQQVVMYVFVLVSNPITLHGSVVLLRLYWFEKRFQTLVREAKVKRRTLTKSKSQARGEDYKPSQGVNGRKIKIIPRTGKAPKLTNDGVLVDLEKGQTHTDMPPSDESDTTGTMTDNSRTQGAEMTSSEAPERPAHEPGEVIQQQVAEGSAESPSEDTEIDNFDQMPGSAHTAIKFADTVKRSDGLDDGLTKFPQLRQNAEHIAILERQRNQDSEVLRIPGPRDAERGQVPTLLDDDSLEEDEDGTLQRIRTADSRPGSRPGSRPVSRPETQPETQSETQSEEASEQPSNSVNRQPAITITEPERRKRDEMVDEAKAWGNTLESLRFRRPRMFNQDQKQVHEDFGEHPSRVRSKTFGTLKSALSREKEDEMPYLSYTPTIGRNSNFIGLSLEEREELGGIEYRSLRDAIVHHLLLLLGLRASCHCLFPAFHQNK